MQEDEIIEWHCLGIAFLFSMKGLLPFIKHLSSHLWFIFPPLYV